MRQHERERLMADVAEFLTTATVPMTDATMTNDVFRYTDPAYTRRELNEVFASQPTVVALSAQLPRPGDFVADELSGDPLVVTRGDDGVVRAFYNVCVHRGTKVVCAEHGNARRHACPFHGWVYDSSGKLVAIPNPEAFPGIAERRPGLTEVTVVERHGLIWRLPPGWGEAELIESLGPLDDELDAYQVNRYVLDRSEVLEQPINWKFVIDGFLETYHFRFLHQSTIGPFVRSNFGPTEQYGRNIRMVALRASYDEHVLNAEGPVDPMPHIAVVYVLFPNTVLVWQGTHHEVWTVHPTAAAPDRSTIRVSVLIPNPAATEQQQRNWDRNWAILMGTVLEEDFAVSRRAQAGFATPAQSQVVYGRNEPALQAFHRSFATLIT